MAREEEEEDNAASVESSQTRSQHNPLLIGAVHPNSRSQLHAHLCYCCAACVSVHDYLEL